MVTGNPKPYDRLVTQTARTVAGGAGRAAGTAPAGQPSRPPRGQALAASAAAWYAALPQRRREVAQDTALALTLAVLNVLSLLPYQSQMHPSWLALFLVAAQCVPLAWRRQWPVAALFCSGIPRNIYDTLQFGYAPLPLAPAIAFATVAERSGRADPLDRRRPGRHRARVVSAAARAHPAVRRDRPVVHLGDRLGGGHPQPGPPAELAAVARRAERAEAELNAAAARAAALPPPSGPGSPASCTTWSPTMSA